MPTAGRRAERKTQSGTRLVSESRWKPSLDHPVSAFEFTTTREVVGECTAARPEVFDDTDQLGPQFDIGGWEICSELNTIGPSDGCRLPSPM